MSQGIKLKYDQIRDNDLSSADDGTTGLHVTYPAPSNVRNLDFVPLDGKRFFRSYSYLVGVDYNPDEQEIFLEFTSIIVTIRGQHLESLYEKLMEQLPRKITAADPRYNQLTEDDEAIVNEIIKEKI
jgi:hypothetical protein